VSRPPDLFRDAQNPARPRPGALIARVDEASDPGAIVRDFRDGDALFSVLVTRSGGEVRAWYNICPHARWPLERPDGQVLVQEGRFLVCAAHGASFTLADGRCLAGPGLGRALRPLPIVVRDGDIRAAPDDENGAA
jgi:nitrite reductase/ring-hydroxylating ferredoxin subunit